MVAKFSKIHVFLVYTSQLVKCFTPRKSRFQCPKTLQDQDRLVLGQQKNKCHSLGAEEMFFFFSQQQFFLYPCYSPPTEPQGLLEGMTVKPLFINIGLGLNSINGYHLTMVISHYAVILQHILIDNTINDCSLLELYALILARRPINPRRE